MTSSQTSAFRGVLAQEVLLWDQLLCGSFLEAKEDGLSTVCHPTGLLENFLWAKVSKFPTDIDLQDFGMKN